MHRLQPCRSGILLAWRDHLAYPLFLGVDSLIDLLRDAGLLAHRCDSETNYEQKNEAGGHAHLQHLR